MKFVITAGHGEGDPGAVAYNVHEADLMMALRDIVAMKLRAYGHEVFTDGPPKKNKALAYALTLFGKAPIQVELHCNASVNNAANGVETISLPKDKKLAQNLSRGVARVLNARVRGEGGWIDQSQAARGKLAFVNNGGLILEVFFLTNLAELNYYRDRSWLVAEEIARILIAARR